MFDILHTGDMGRTAEELNKRKGYDLTVKQIYGELMDIAQTGGAGSVEKKNKPSFKSI